MQMEKKKSRRKAQRPFPHVKPYARRILPIIALVTLIGASALAYGPFKSLIFASSPGSSPAPQSELSRKHRGPLAARLGLFPEPSKMRRRLGQRFVKSGREVSTLHGILSLGAERQSIQIQRRLDDDGESVSIVLSGKNAILTWDRKNGSRVNSEAATGSDKDLIEKVVFDSPDHFVLGQLGAASYQPVAVQVRPEEAGDREDYDGPLWNIVGLMESTGPQKDSAKATRLYYINCKTGLIDRVLLQDAGGAVITDFLDWSATQGELSPGRVVWRRSDNVLMEIAFSVIGYSPKP